MVDAMPAIGRKSAVARSCRVAKDSIAPLRKDLAERLAAMRRAGQIEWSGRKLAPMKPVAKARGKRTVARLLVDHRR